jgi:DNA-binding MarR family transcriptional regulator
MIDLCSIRKIQRALRRFEETLEGETGLTLNEAMCLCATSKGMNEPGHLARELDLSPSRLSRVLEALEGKKLIARKISESDRRGITVTLTRTGKSAIEKYRCADIEIPEELAFTQQ